MKTTTTIQPIVAIACVSGRRGRRSINMSLQLTLKALLDTARRQPSEPARVALGRGLIISLRIAGGRLHLQLERQGAPPSNKELETVINHWPEKDLVQHSNPRRLTRHYLMTSWPVDEPTHSAP